MATCLQSEAATKKKAGQSLTKCKYCGDGEPSVLTSSEYSGIELMLFPKLGYLRARVYLNSDEIFDTQDVALIKYCPFCGRELEVAHE